MRLTRSCFLVTSWRSASLNAPTANFVALYTPAPARALRPATELTLTRSATPRGPAEAACSKCASAALVQYISAETLRSSIRFHSPTSASGIGPSSMTPALLTRVSSRPKCATVSATTARARCSSVTSASSTSASPPAARMRAASASSRSRRRATSATCAPCAASATAVASPIPELAPVTSATVPSSVPAMALRCRRLEERPRELRRIERRERVLSLAETDVFHRHDDLVDDPHEHAAFRGGVELGDDDARQLRRFVEELRLRERVLARRAVDHEQRLGRWRARLALDDTPHLLQLFHQVRLRLQAPGGVDEHDVDAARFRGAHPVEHDGRRIGALRAAHVLRARALRPHLELLGGRRAKRVRGNHHHALALRAQQRRELADRRGLAAPVDADDEDDRGLRLEIEPHLGQREKVLHVAAEALDHLIARLVAVLLGDDAQRVDDLRRRRHAEVGLDEELLEVVPQLVVDRAPRERHRLQLAAERLPRAGQRRLDLSEPTHGTRSFRAGGRSPIARVGDRP